ncbi:aldehyde dehydrogenase family protein [Phaeobacter sp. HF9A]|uniref:aldehyde dehydrogenase family protein n=1 Tax=Phaeobacter sp. HF9A TaxID=2721561 RepID=UPI00142FE25D|nr:aldehyde dehydrogenase family protein [Phaeobacter sp. HF9A]NIZ13028.1 aldehyde dehydrogenase family protein [Phaeobacter sp. HF9A]
MRLDQAYIGGAWQKTQAVAEHEIINPATGTAIGTLALSGAEDGARAVQAASAAFDAWAETSVAERKAVLERVLACYEARAEDLAVAMTREMGAPATMSAAAQVGAGKGHLKDFIKAIEKVHWISTPDVGDGSDRIMMAPMGVAVLITPWNWPMNQITLKVGAALAAGCTMVLKPSELSPLSAQVFAEIMHAAEVPAGVFNMVFGTGPDLGEALVRHPDVATVSLTGSTRAGAAVTHAAADDIKRVSLELGGKGACLVFSDADPVAAGRETAVSMFRNTGQSCNAPSRMLVERSVYDQVVKAASDVAQSLKVGDPEDAATDMGPLANLAQYERVKSFMAKGKEEARLVTGGGAADEGGFFVEPTVFADVTNDMTIAREEIFGPVLSIIPFDTEAEAIAMANDSPYGLAAYLWTTDAARAQRLSRKLRSGMVRLNGTDIPFGAPFGGFGQSGIGREGGVWGIEEFLEVKAVSGWIEEA